MFQRKLVESNKVFVIVITWKTSSILDKSFLPIQIVKTTQLKCPNPEKHNICKKLDCLVLPATPYVLHWMELTHNESWLRKCQLFLTPVDVQFCRCA